MIWLFVGVAGELLAFKEWLSPLFWRRELKETGTAFVDRLLSGVERDRLVDG